MKTSKDLAIELLRYKNVDEVLKDAISNKESKIWGFAQDAAIEFLQKKYFYIKKEKIEQIVLDITSFVIEYTIKQLRKKEITNSIRAVWYLTMYNKKEIKLPYELLSAIVENNTKKIIAWLIDRFINNLENILFDKRSKVIDKIQFFNFNSLENGEELISSSLYKIA